VLGEAAKSPKAGNAIGGRTVVIPAESWAKRHQGVDLLGADHPPASHHQRSVLVVFPSVPITQRVGQRSAPAGKLGGSWGVSAGRWAS
jgi:hypothetical protein